MAPREPVAYYFSQQQGHYDSRRRPNKYNQRPTFNRIMTMLETKTAFSADYATKAARAHKQMLSS